MRKILSTFSAVAALGLALLAPASEAQNTIVTAAGGGPNNLPALASSIGLPYSIAEDLAGNFYVADNDSNRVFKIDTSGNVTVIAGNTVNGYAGDGGPAVNAELNSPDGVFADNFGDIFIADTGNSVIREVVAGSGNIQTVAGNGVKGYSGDGGPALNAELGLPEGIFVDGAGDIFIADSANSVIREVVASTGNIQTVAGNGSIGYSGDGGLATSAQLNLPGGVSVDGAGDIFIADTGNSVVREVVATTGNISTFAGNGISGYSGDNGPPTSAELASPQGVFLDGAGDVFIADSGNSVIRVVSSVNIIQTFAGTGTPGYSGDGGPATTAELNHPNGVWVDGAGNAFIADTQNYVIRQVVAGSFNIQTNIGNHTQGYSGDGSAATQAEIYGPEGVAADGSGNIFIADTDNFVIREVIAATGKIQTVAGNGVAGYLGDGGPATSAELNLPVGVFVDSAGNIFIADRSNSVIREVVAATGKIQTVAGNGVAGYTGDGGLATNASLYYPHAVFVDNSGNIFIADTYNNVIREVSATSHVITTMAGNGVAGYNGDNIPATTAELNLPTGVFVDNSGNVFIADSNQRVREVIAQTGTIQTVAGNGTAGYSGDGGPATNAQLDYPWDVFVDPAGNIFISDEENYVVREVDALTGNIQTVAGIHEYGFGGDGGLADAAMLTECLAIAADPFGNLLIADFDALRVRRVAALVATSTTTTLASNPNPSAISTGVTFTATVATRGSKTPTGTVTFKDGGTTLGAATLNASAAAAYTASSLTVGQHSITAGYSGDANNGGSTSAVLIQTVQQATPAATTTTLVSTANPSMSGSSVMFTATTATTGSQTPTGTITFKDGSTTLGTSTLSGGVATDTTSSLAAGQHSITAVYGGDSNNAGSTSSVLAQTVNAADFTLTSNPTTATIPAGQTGTFTLTVTPQGSFTSAISFSCSGLPSPAGCTFSPATVTPKTSTVTTTLNITTTARTASLAPAPFGRGSSPLYAIWLVLPTILLGTAWVAAPKRGKLLGYCLVFLLFSGGLLQVACGGGNMSGGGGGGTVGTPAGTYTVTVTGVAGSTEHITAVTLTVQ